MSLWSLLDGGVSMPEGRTGLQRLALWCGYRLATRGGHVHIDPTCRISPEARICARSGSIRIGPNSTVALGTIIQGNVRLGAHCSVQAYSILVGYGSRDNPTGAIDIGDYVRIAPHVMMIAANHVFADPDRSIHSQGLAPAPIIIEDDCWIGGRVTLTAGVRIGRCSVIGAGAVVTRDIPAYSLAVGVPAKVVRSRRPGEPNVSLPT